MNRNIGIVAAIVIVFVSVILSGFAGFLSFDIFQENDLQKSTEYTGQYEKLIIGVEYSLLSAIFLVAENNGYFQDEGLELTIKKFDSGRNALASMLSDENLDMVTVAQTPIVFNSFDRSDYSIIATMVKSTNDVKLLARNDVGISSPADLAGKKIGVTIGSTGHFFLELFLAEHGLTSVDSEFIDINASELSDALKEGRVDAISTWEPNIYNAMQGLPYKTILFTSDILREDFYFVVNEDFGKNESAIKKFLSATIRGEEFIKNNPDKSKKIISEILGVSKEFVDSVWNDFEFGITLDQSVLVTLEHEARWAIQSGYSGGVEDTPNYLEYINFETLEALSPESVDVVH